MITADGTIHRTRPIDRMGAHAKGSNRDSIGVCAVGDNTQPDQKWTMDQRRSLHRIVRALWDVFGPLEVKMHRHAGTTATVCPGIRDVDWHAITLALRMDQPRMIPIVGGEEPA